MFCGNQTKPETPKVLGVITGESFGVQCKFVPVLPLSWAGPAEKVAEPSVSE